MYVCNMHCATTIIQYYLHNIAIRMEFSAASTYALKRAVFCNEITSQPIWQMLIGN